MVSMKIDFLELRITSLTSTPNAAPGKPAEPRATRPEQPLPRATGPCANTSAGVTLRATITPPKGNLAETPSPS